ncbi:hypothetical protein GCM10007094_27250 [Pseudovibrio japonicus]|uniref:Peptidase C39-like domain-containing protein n=1 Tax=Pseudovibrio japonicus TaxID=366534 RepID=A0ABQ3EF70_9HYPH|nr:hypothetical protein [Pseudovibrio japonicus]GHB36167.1 hypothetical protein GCM10007094_27250 [Pseudovibrio japonicus]
MADFEVYKGIVQHSPKSCGAYCINAALTDLGLTATAADANKLNTADVSNGYDGSFGDERVNLWRVKHFESERLQVAAEVGKKTYGVTGNLELRMGSKQALYRESSDCTDLENSPSGMVEVAAKTCPTLAKNITYYTAFGKALFNGLTLMNAGGGDLFDREEKLITTNIKKQVKSSPLKEIPFQKTQMNVILVRYKDTETMHWIAGTLDVNDAKNAVIYDPATGDVLKIPIASNFELQTGLTVKPATTIGPNSYEFPGIWIRLEV